MRWVVLALAAIAARAVTFGNPIVFVDEEFYYVAARAIVHGALPYVDVWDRKPIGLFALYLPAGLFAPPVGVLVYQAMALVAVVATALGIARLADRLGWRRGALAGALLYVVWIDLADGQGGQSPVFYNALMIAAVLRIAGARPASRRRRGLQAMALVGLALQIKYSVVFEGIVFGLWLLWEEWRARPAATVGGGVGAAAVARYAAALCAVALAPTALVFLAYAAAGHGEAFLYANFLSILARHGDTADEVWNNVSTSLGILVPILLLAVAGLRKPVDNPAARAFLALWLGAAVFGFAIFGSWFNHYTLPVLVPASVAAAGLLGTRKLAVPVLLLAFVAGQIVLQSERRARGTPAQFDAITAAVGKGPGALYVYSGTTMLYAASGRPALSPYLFPTHLMLAREQGAVGVHQPAEVLRILAQRPAVVVMQRLELGERPEIRALVTHWLERARYVRIAHAPVGRATVDVYRQPITPAPSPAVR